MVSLGKMKIRKPSFNFSKKNKKEIEDNKEFAIIVDPVAEIDNHDPISFEARKIDDYGGPASFPPDAHAGSIPTMEDASHNSTDVMTEEESTAASDDDAYSLAKQVTPEREAGPVEQEKEKATGTFPLTLEEKERYHYQALKKNTKQVDVESMTKEVVNADSPPSYNRWCCGIFSL
mmetsp:Transcript_26015/g.49502  ORF Transcript_26015/g.49502 Transcript_26015/m.49502 type:complete len:176 (-) Transcript_26015:562-1089(-)|eukprot:CAMPEP_0201621216 /NCGR_PEP_ID=MMETSP0492-20130828/46245_1 /ASSEMBLY_ACC=CAM_ASM_000837 /TAXON_ID=420259 /ORGANISM="Thalassiosira gravida, Strain GMp14c1" /LENGTH=175 /DNA_ID=CAMNT_0048090687 /DNA_START=81 /DNA_END=608 /DNA_ORIENTATION=+